MKIKKRKFFKKKQDFSRNKLAKLQIDGIFTLCDRDIAQLGLARLSGGQKVASSNLAIPTICSVYGISDTTFEAIRNSVFLFSCGKLLQESVSGCNGRHFLKNRQKINFSAVVR